MSSSNLLIDSPEHPLATVTNRAIESVDLKILRSFDEAQEEGESDFVLELINLYLNEVPRLFSAIREAIAKDDWPSIKRAAHSVRGSSSNLGILQIAVIAGALEQLAANQHAPVGQLLLSLQDEFTRVEKILSAERQRRTV
ncbi:MAG TPA: Hpt domain-containing protein [Pyrinomonadaceae bacterium]|nr:Hpt domain-containing protein [Pyrinomonadaceae bacterium]